MNARKVLIEIKSIHDRRQQIALAQLEQAKAAEVRLNTLFNSVDSQLLLADENLKSDLTELFAQTQDPEHFRALPINIGIAKLRHRDARLFLDNQKMQIAEQLVRAKEDILDRQLQCHAASRKQEKFKVLLKQEEERLEASIEVIEEEQAMEMQSQKRGMAHAR